MLMGRVSRWVNFISAKIPRVLRELLRVSCAAIVINVSAQPKWSKINFLFVYMTQIPPNINFLVEPICEKSESKVVSIRNFGHFWEKVEAMSSKILTDIQRNTQLLVQHLAQLESPKLLSTKMKSQPMGNITWNIPIHLPISVPQFITKERPKNLGRTLLKKFCHTEPGG